MAYDRADWHYGGEYPDDLPARHHVSDVREDYDRRFERWKQGAPAAGRSRRRPWWQFWR